MFENECKQTRNELGESCKVTYAKPKIMNGSTYVKAFVPYNQCTNKIFVAVISEIKKQNLLFLC